MMLGYARVSSTDQSLDLQLAALRAAGCARVFSEKRSATTLSSRTALEECILAASPGDIIVCVRLDRLARSTLDLLNLLKRLEAASVGFRCLTQPVDTTTAMGRMVLTMLGAVAEFENDLRRERQLAGIVRAKSTGRYARPPHPLRSLALRLHREDGLSVTRIVEKLQPKVTARTVYRWIGT
jgi:DNA invertase Pin-like site-specific DNA recombinase